MPSTKRDITPACYNKQLRRSNRLMKKNNHEAKSFLGAGRDNRSGSERKNKADNTKFTIFDLNAYCLIEVMRNLSIGNLMKLELADSYFGQYSSSFYARHPVKMSPKLMPIRTGYGVKSGYML